MKSIWEKEEYVTIFVCSFNWAKRSRIAFKRYMLRALSKDYCRVCFVDSFCFLLQVWFNSCSTLSFIVGLTSLLFSIGQAINLFSLECPWWWEHISGIGFVHLSSLGHEYLKSVHLPLLLLHWVIAFCFCFLM